MNLRTTVFPLLALSLIITPLNTLAQNDKGRGPEKHMMWKQLNLSEDQAAKLKDLHKEMQQTRQNYFEKVKVVRDKVKTELLKNKSSKEVLYSFAKELGDLDRVFSEQRTDHLLKIKDVLSPEQVSKVIEHEANGPGKWGKGEACPATQKCPKSDNCTPGPKCGMSKSQDSGTAQ